jgi:large subunit ribosomal protein L23
MNLYEVLRRPLVTEKNTALQVQGKYAFEVDRSANKQQIKQAIQIAFNVTVTAVNVVTVPGSRRKVGRREIFSSPWKKAIVTLKPGDKIQVFEGV